MSWDPAGLPRGEGSVGLVIEGPVAHVTIDNPSARNAMSPGMMVDLVQIIGVLEDAQVAVVLIRGATDKAFCAGGDLRSVAFGHTLRGFVGLAMVEGAVKGDFAVDVGGRLYAAEASLRGFYDPTSERVRG